MALCEAWRINITALGRFSSIIFENFQFTADPNRSLSNSAEFSRPATDDRIQLYYLSAEQASEQLGIEPSNAFCVCSATGDIGVFL